MKQDRLQASGFRLTIILSIVLGLSSISPRVSARGQAAEQSEAQKQIQSQGAYFDSGVWKTTYRADLSEDEKVAGLSKLWSEVKYNFAYFDHVPELDWDKTYLEYLPRVRQTKSTFEYYRVLQEMCALLRDGHTSVSLPDELWRQMSARPPMRSEMIDGRCVVTRVSSETLRGMGIVPGLELLRIDDLPVSDYAERFIRPYVSSSTPQDLASTVYGFLLLAGPAARPVQLTVQDAEGKTSVKAIPRQGYDDVKTLPSFEFTVLEGNVGYVVLRTFGQDSILQSFYESFARIAQTDSLIIDVRANPGGSSGIGWNILACLTDKPFRISRWKTRQYRPSFRAWGNAQDWHGKDDNEWKPNGEKLYSKPVVVLTSPVTGSAAEDFCVAFDFVKRGKIIGEPTSGSTGQPLFFELPGAGRARVCTKRDSYPDGKEFVGVGIQPDIVVRQTIPDLRAGRDSVLQAALKELKTSAKK